MKSLLRAMDGSDVNLGDHMNLGDHVNPCKRREPWLQEIPHGMQKLQKSFLEQRT